MNNQMQNYNKKSNYEIDDEIDLGYLLDLSKRNKYLIASISFLSFLVCIIYAISKPKIWQGSFQILMTNQSEIDQKYTASNLMNQVTGKFDSSFIITEVEILKSPYVLKPVLDYINDESSKSNSEEGYLSFYDWKANNLNIELEDGTTILNVEYFDNDRYKIIPILKKISKEYQKYSVNKKAKEIKLSKSFLQKQISEYQIKISDFMKKSAINSKADEFRYLELIRETSRIEKTLTQLENNLMYILLEEEKINDPWQIITEPNLKNKPIAISKRKAGLIGLLVGLFFGIITSHIKERTSGYIYQKKFLEKILESKIIYKLDLQNNNSIESFLNFMNKFSEINGSKKIRFISLSLEKETNKNLNMKIFNKNNFLFTSEIYIPKNENEILIFITSNKLEKFKYVNDFKNKLSLLNNKIDGILFLK